MILVASYVSLCKYILSIKLSVCCLISTGSGGKYTDNYFIVSATKS